LYSSQNIVRVIKLRRIRWTGHIAHIGAGKNHSENPDTERRKILNWVLKKWDGRALTGLIWLRIETNDRLL
jgi:hypothetical protein